MIPEAWRQGEVAVIGLARSGLAAARLLRAHGIPVYGSDIGTTDALRARVAELAALGVAVELGRHDLGRIGRAAAVVVSPGVPPQAPVLEAAHAAGRPVIAEVELAYLALREMRYAAVTGSNGKTTTATLLGHLLRCGGLPVEVAGNVGRPLSTVALEGTGARWAVVEISSFQLHDVDRFAPDLGVLTNLAPNHLDRYPDLDAYYADKARLFRHDGPEATWVLNGDDPAVLAMTSSLAGRRVHWSLRRTAAAWYDQESRTLMMGGECLLPRAQLKLLGDHNVSNALAASLGARAAGVEIGSLARGLATFAPLPHRLEPVGEVDRVVWINDSKATNVSATAVAIAAMERPFVLLLGGRHKGERYDALGPRLRARGVAVVAYGEAAPLIDEDLGRVVRCERATSFDDAVSRAHRLAKPGHAVLLSPACSSYDVFRNYEERGDRFRALVERL